MEEDNLIMQINKNEKLISELQSKKEILKSWRIRGTASAVVEVALICTLGTLLCTTPVSSLILTCGALLMSISSLAPITSLLKFVRTKKDISSIDDEISSLTLENENLNKQLISQCAENLTISKRPRKINTVSEGKKANNKVNDLTK